MAFSASDWRTRLSEWSGSIQGDRSWSGLGRSTRIGEYFNYWYKSGPYIYFVYRGFSYPNQSPTAERNVEPYYMYALYRGYVYVYRYFINSGYTQIIQNYSFDNYFNNYVGQGNYTGFGAYVSYNTFSSFQGSFNTYYTTIVNRGQYSQPLSWSPSTFYNYAPWGAGPYSANSNISIGAGNGPFSGYPYQYIHT